MKSILDIRQKKEKIKTANTRPFGILNIQLTLANLPEFTWKNADLSRISYSKMDTELEL
jgi:hypothetical protein